jgi:DNA-binding response OmpR family regulator
MALGELELDQFTCIVRYAGEPIRLGALEYKIISTLMINPGNPMTYRRLGDEGLGWGEMDEADISKILPRVFHMINKKLRDAGASYAIQVTDGKVAVCTEN